MTNRTAATCPTDPWASEVQPLIADLRRQVAWKELRHREALEALEAACDQRDEARRQSSMLRMSAAHCRQNAAWTGWFAFVGWALFLGAMAMRWLA